MVYKLSASLASHSSDVRAVASPEDAVVLSASRDSTAIYWQRQQSAPTAAAFAPASLLKAGSRYVNAITYLPPTPDAPQGYAITGGQDTVINVFALDSATPTREEPNYTLIGHSENVCALDSTAGGVIVSGSWDRTAKVWKGFQLAYELKGHQQSVWAVKAVGDDEFLTGSADKTVKLWQQHKQIRTFEGHTDAVRGLTLLPDIGFASCSNDSEIRVWTLEGDAIFTLSGHTSFVYSLASLSNGDIVSSGEDRTVRIWRDGECAQTIVHPAVSVWAVSTMPNGDIVSGASDGTVRIFSAVEERWANAQDLKDFDSQVASQALPSQQVGDVKKSDLPGVEALAQPGKKDGDVKMVRNGDVVEAHQWDSASGNWQKIGDVVDAVGSGRKQLYEGKEYDYVFDVDIQDGIPPLKLPYNTSENPFTAAQNFLQRNDLPLTYIDQVVKFIEQNTAGVTLGANNDYVDPWTGATRYQSTAPPAANSAASTYSDPWTGANRYQSNATVPAQNDSSSQYSDPYTGASRYSGAPSRPAAPAQASKPSSVLPVSRPVTFKQANVPAMRGKINQIDEALRNEISTSSLAMYPSELRDMDVTFDYLTCISATPPRNPDKAPSAENIEAILTVLERWPESARFPVLDLNRLVLGHCKDIFADAQARTQFLAGLFAAAEWTDGQGWETPQSKMRETNVLLLLRAVANMFQEGTPVNEGSWVNNVLEKLVQAPYQVLSKNQRVTLATIVFNISCEAVRKSINANIRSPLISLVLSILNSEKTDSEASYRALVALGNIVYGAKNLGSPLSSEHASGVTTTVQVVAAAFPEERVKGVAGEIKALL